MYALTEHLLAQRGRSLHGWVSVAFPTHDFPPFCGAGLLQRRVEVWEASPQVAVQAENGFQGDQPPSTVKEKNSVIFLP